MKILMVCLGNICRSPLAEGIFRSKLDNSFTVDSAGTGDWHVGEKPDKRSQAVAKNHGIDISQLRARQITYQDFDEFDYIFVMDRANYDNVVSLTKNSAQKQKVKMILEDGKNVPDPYYGEEEDFESVFQLLDSAIDDWVKELTKS